MNSVLITGGAGFIGSRLAQLLLAQGQSVTVVDNLHPQVHGRNPGFPETLARTRLVRGDVRDRTIMAEAVAQADPDIIYHLAAETGTGQSYDEPARYCDVNVQGTCHLIEAMRRLPARARRVVLAGSRAVYGEGAYLDRHGAVVTGAPRSLVHMAAGRFGLSDEAGYPLTPCATSESLQPRPASIYASTKLMQEYVLDQAGAGSGIEVVLLRFQNVYGPGQSLFNAYTGVLSIFAKQIMDGLELNIFEDGDIGRDFVFVDDVVRALDLAGQAIPAPRGPVNIGSGQATTIVSAARTLLAALGPPTDRLRISGEFRPGDVRYSVADIERARQLLHWRPEVSLEAGLSRLAAWAREERQAGRI